MASSATKKTALEIGLGVGVAIPCTYEETSGRHECDVTDVWTLLMREDASESKSETETETETETAAASARDAFRYWRSCLTSHCADDGSEPRLLLSLATESPTKSSSTSPWHALQACWVNLGHACASQHVFVDASADAVMATTCLGLRLNEHMNRTGLRATLLTEADVRALNDPTVWNACANVLQLTAHAIDRPELVSEPTVRARLFGPVVQFVLRFLRFLVKTSEQDRVHQAHVLLEQVAVRDSLVRLMNSFNLGTIPNHNDYGDVEDEEGHNSEDEEGHDAKPRCGDLVDRIWDNVLDLVSCCAWQADLVKLLPQERRLTTGSPARSRQIGGLMRFVDAALQFGRGLLTRTSQRTWQSSFAQAVARAVKHGVCDDGDDVNAVVLDHATRRTGRVLLLYRCVATCLSDFEALHEVDVATRDEWLDRIERMWVTLTDPLVFTWFEATQRATKDSWSSSSSSSVSSASESASKRVRTRKCTRGVWDDACVRGTFAWLCEHMVRASRTSWMLCFFNTTKNDDVVDSEDDDDDEEDGVRDDSEWSKPRSRRWGAWFAFLLENAQSSAERSDALRSLWGIMDRFEFVDSARRETKDEIEARCLTRAFVAPESASRRARSMQAIVHDRSDETNDQICRALADLVATPIQVSATRSASVASILCEWIHRAAHIVQAGPLGPAGPTGPADGLSDDGEADETDDEDDGDEDDGDEDDGDEDGDEADERKTTKTAPSVREYEALSAAFGALHCLRQWVSNKVAVFDEAIASTERRGFSRHEWMKDLVSLLGARTRWRTAALDADAEADTKTRVCSESFWDDVLVGLEQAALEFLERWLAETAASHRLNATSLHDVHEIVMDQVSDIARGLECQFEAMTDEVLATVTALTAADDRATRSKLVPTMTPTQCAEVMQWPRTKRFGRVGLKVERSLLSVPSHAMILCEVVVQLSKYGGAFEAIRARANLWRWSLRLFDAASKCISEESDSAASSASESVSGNNEVAAKQIQIVLVHMWDIVMEMEDSFEANETLGPSSRIATVFADADVDREEALRARGTALRTLEGLLNVATSKYFSFSDRSAATRVLARRMLKFGGLASICGDDDDEVVDFKRRMERLWSALLELMDEVAPKGSSVKKNVRLKALVEAATEESRTQRSANPDNLVTCRVETVDPIKCSVKRFMSDGTFKIESSEERVFMTITVAVRHRGGFIPEQNMDSVEIFAVDVLLRLIPVPVSAFPDKELCNTYRFGHDFAWWDVEIGVVRASR